MRHDTQHNDIYHNDPLHNDIHQYDTQHNDNQHNGKMLSVTNKPFKLNVVMLSVMTPNVQGQGSFYLSLISMDAIMSTATTGTTISCSLCRQ
jgi:hypothetical protein